MIVMSCLGGTQQAHYLKVEFGELTQLEHSKEFNIAVLLGIHGHLWGIEDCGLIGMN